jgi:phosphotransferase system IIB component
VEKIGTLGEDFLLGNLWWIVILGILFLFVAAYFLEKWWSAFRQSKDPKFSKGLYLEALGGSENVLDGAVEGSRIVIHLKDYDKIDDEKLTKAGVTGFIAQSDKLTLVVKDDAAKVYDLIFKA